MARQPVPFTTARAGLQATVPLYLDDVTVDAEGNITGYRIAFLSADADPDEVKRLLADSINLSDPAHCRVYDKNDRYLAGHPGTPQAPKDRLLVALIRRAVAKSPLKRGARA